ncbi:MAG: N-6 DNA methylase [Chloroflexi bacterium]|nr:N-6 DNA methylase [Chloroflexota bacterium]
MSAPAEIAALVGRFDQSRSAYMSGHYNETQVRHEFIDPFFKALGWDVNNEQGYAESYKDVVHEDSIKVGGATKAPDYCFRVGGTRKFYVEAKRPGVNIKDNADGAFQIRRYAWSSKLPLSILTDFEEFAVYDCRIKPAKTDKASAARTLSLHFTDYAPRWDELASVFSRDAVLKGSFDKYADSTKAKKGTAEVDDALLAEIESWRDVLAHNLALRNPGLTRRELNFAVQSTIDRIIFLRICEDRGIEEYGRLMALQNGTRVYERLGVLFQRADERYNSGLFHFHREKGRTELPDELTLGLVLDDKPLKDIFKSLYYPDSPYEFSVLPANILGHVYEQFLGKVIRLTEGHHAVIEDKPEVKKAGGVYYTPTYIVDYIVKQTVGKLLEGRRPGPRGSASQLKIIDPACGSGSFLIGAYQYLLDWHRDQYVADGTKKHTRELYQGPGGDWRLTTGERKRILLNNIYGVDIDAQAVETTKLSLLLKVLEGESEQTVSRQLAMFHERALPDLANNIKCGNSLIGPDFYDNRQASFLDEEARYRVNVFDWQNEFPDVLRRPDGGFDAVIGNPPYIRMENFKEIKSYLKAAYASHDERSDLYAYFIERAHSLLSDRGVFGMIVSNKFLRSNYGSPLRRFLSQNAVIERVVDLAGLPVFIGATVRTLILVTSRASSGELTVFYAPPLAAERFRAVTGGSLSIEQSIAEITYEVPRRVLGQAVWNFAMQDTDSLISGLQSRCQPLAEYCMGQICMGIKSGLTEAFVIDSQTYADIVERNPGAKEIIKPFLNGRDVRRYHTEPKDIYIVYTHHGVNISDYPAVEQHLRQFKDRLGRRATRQEWYELQQPQYNFASYMAGPKIIFPDIAIAPRFALDTGGHYCSNTTYFIPGYDPYLLGLLNSRCAYFYFAHTCAGLEGSGETYLRFFGQYLGGFPVPVLNLSDSVDKMHLQGVVDAVERMHALWKQFGAASTAHEKTVLQRQIDAVDRQIDAMVYQLYDLTDEEIAVVERVGGKP